MSKGGDGIQIFLRIRPTKRPSGYLTLDDADPSKLAFKVPRNEDVIVNNTRTDYRFKFNGILGPDARQEEVYDRVGSVAVENALSGFNSTIFAYGQTGSGKTFTITGGSERYIDRGIIPRALSALFKRFQSDADTKYSAFISYLEIYNNDGYDLLDSTHETSKLEDMRKVAMLEDEDGNYHLKNLSMHPVSSEEDALNCLFLGDTNRAISETDMNQASSRSHCIFTVSIEQRKTGADTVVRSKLHLVDLAGSERVHKTSSSGQTLREAKYINSSLFFLEMVIVALHEQSKKSRTHIPYRNSMMTSVLRDSLGGNCKTVMVATISPERAHTDESISTCNFAQRVALVKNVAQINEDVDPDTIIRRLKAELSALREEIRFLKGEAGEGYDLSEEQREELKRKVMEYVDDRDIQAMLNIGSMTLTKIRDVHAIFKNLVLEAREEGGGGSGDPELEKQVGQLRNSLQQRDNEIAILVNMVKQGKKMPGTAEAKDSRGSSASTSGRVERKASGGPIQGGREGNRERIIQQLAEKVVGGVSLCKDRGILDDPAKAFEYFKSKYPGAGGIEENKALLKSKYAEAKKTGELVNRARGSINYLKTTIEQLRRERAMERVVEDAKGEEKDDVDPEEAEHRKQIDQEKFVYKSNFNKLRELKSAIEHIQRLLEKSRVKMQTDFDAWYKHCVDFTTRYSGPDKPNPPGSAASTEVEDYQQENDTSMTAAPKRTDAAPLTSKITGNAEADADIQAFFRAKEELMRRSQSKATS